MPEAPRRTRQSTLAGTVALAFTLVAGSSASASAQTAAAKAGAGVFPLSPVFTVALDAFPVLAPVYDGTRAYMVLAADLQDPASSARLAALSLANGAVQWSRDIGQVSEIVAGDDQVFVCGQGALAAYSARDGQPRWQLPLPAPLSAPLHYDAGWLIALTEASDALAIRASDGARVWERHLPSPGSGEAAIAGDALYLALTDNRVLRLKLDAGSIVWDRRIVSKPIALLALGERVFVGTTGWFYALEPEHGKVLWRTRVGAPVIGTPSADRHRVYFLALDNLLRALAREGGPLKWRQIMGHREQYGPLLVGGLVFVSGRSPTIQAYDATSGTPAGSYDAPSDLAAPVHAVPGLLDTDFLLMVLTGEGQFIVLRPQSLQPEGFAVSPRAYLRTGFPIWRW